MINIPEGAVRAQQGPQRRFLKSPADICIYGGAAGGGKTYGLLLDPLRYIDDPDFGAVIFRRTYPEIMGEDGIWEESQKLYSRYSRAVNQSDLRYTFESGAQIRFAHLQYEKTKFEYKGSQIAYIGFDELSSFTRGQFFYMLSRNRSMSNVKPMMRGGTNPPEEGADHWLTKFLWWWLDTDDNSDTYGLPIEDRIGKMRYFVRDPDDQLVWGSTKDEVIENAPHLKAAVEDVPRLTVRDLVKSMTFIPAKIYDNEILLNKNPEYLGNLLSLHKANKTRLLEGNWLKRVATGEVFDKDDFPIIKPEEVPSDLKWSRHWDLAGTKPSEANPNPDWTVGSLMAEKDGVVFWKDCRMFRENPGRRDRKIANVASQDGKQVAQFIEEEPGQAGKSQIKHFARNVLKGYAVKGTKPTGPKEVRWQAPAAAAQRGEIKVVRGEWNERALDQLDNTSAEDDSKKDVADTLSQFWDTRLTEEEPEDPFIAFA